MYSIRLLGTAARRDCCAIPHCSGQVRGAKSAFSKTRPPPRVRLEAFSPSTDLTRLTCLLGQRLVELALVKEAFFRLKRASVDDPDLLTVGSIHTEDSKAAAGHTQVKKPGLSGEPGRIGQKPDREGIFERFFDTLQSQRAIEIERRVIPIKLHSCLIVYRSPMQCRYNVFTHGAKLVKWKIRPIGRIRPIFCREKPLRPAHSSFLPPPASPTRFMRSMSGRNMAITMLPTITARKTIMIGSSREVMAATALSTSSS